jgi:hypothetical protein
MDAIVSGKNLLAHWVYSDEETKKHAQQEYAQRREANQALFAVMGGMLVLAMIAILLVDGADGVGTDEILLVALVILYVVSHVAPRIELNRALGATKEAHVAKNGIIYEGAVYLFRSFLVGKYKVSFEEGSGSKPPVLVFAFAQLVGIIPRFFDISVPVPPDQVDRAREIAGQLGGKLPGE